MRRKIHVIRYARILLAMLFLSTAVAAATYHEGDEFIDEILQEERNHYGERNDPFLRDEDVLREKQQQAQAEKDHVRAQAEKRRREREAKFQKELSRMNREQQKKAKAQRQKDSAIVDSILNASERGDLYGVIGLHYHEVEIPARKINLFGKIEFETPHIVLFRLSEKAIKKAYRIRSRLVHPDRNKDGRAEEAFIVLEECSSILMNANQRAAYNSKLKSLRQSRQDAVVTAVQTSIRSVYQVGVRVIGVFRSALGPFAVPVAILGCLIV